MPGIKAWIDARRAKTGSKDFKGSADTTKRAASGMTRDLKKSDKAMKSLGKSSSVLKGRLIGLVSGFSALLILRKITTATAEQQAATAQLRAGLESTNFVSGQTLASLQALGNEMQNLTTFNNELVESSAAVLLSFTKINDDIFPRTIKVAGDVATRMGIDLQSAIVQLGKALNDPVANLGALSRSGIQFTKDQKSLIKELWETGRATEAQIIILKELEAQYGGSAEAAANTFGGALTQLKNDFDDLFKVTDAGAVGSMEGFIQGIRQVVQHMGGAKNDFSTIMDDILIGIKDTWEQARFMVAFAGTSIAVSWKKAVAKILDGVVVVGRAFRDLAVIVQENSAFLGETVNAGIGKAITNMTVNTNKLAALAKLYHVEWAVALVGVRGEHEKNQAALEKETEAIHQRNAELLIAKGIGAGTEAGAGGVDDAKEQFDIFNKTTTAIHQITLGLLQEHELIGKTKDERAQILLIAKAENIAMGKASKLGKEITANEQKFIDLASETLAIVQLRRSEHEKEVAIRKQSEEDSRNAIKATMEEFKKEQEEIKQFWTQIGESIGDSIGGAIEGLIDKTLTWKDALKSVLEDIARIAFRQLVTQQISGAIGSAFGAASTGGGPGPGIVAQGLTAFDIESAMGNVFSNGSLVPFATGGVVNSPTIFPLNNGDTGIMGEGGNPEAIIPLARGRGGVLGVRSEGGSGGGGTIIINIQGVQNVQDFNRSRGQLANIARGALMQGGG